MPDPVIHRMSEAGVVPHAEDSSAVRRGKLGSAVSGSVVYDQQLGCRPGLGGQAGEQPRQILAAVPHRNNRADAHRKKRFLKRNARFCKPSRQGLSLISPRREEYMMEISPKRMREFRRASILISSENAMPSDSSFISLRIRRRKTHMPDCESRTHRKKSTDVAIESARFPILCLKLMAWRSRTGKREALRKSTSRCSRASIRYESASTG